MTAAAHARGARVTAHSGDLHGARAAVAGGVDSIEHGFELDADVVREMVSRGTRLVSTLAVMRSWQTFATTTRIDRFTSAEGRRRIAARQEAARASVQLAHAAGVPIATGTDFGGGSLRANQLAWEVEALVDAGFEPWEALARRRGAAASCWASRRRASSARAARPTSCSCTATRWSTRRRSGGSGGWPGLPR